MSTSSRVLSGRETAVIDNWANRAKNMCCETCMWFVPKLPSENLGRCRRHAPTMSGFPAVFNGDWCGDHKLDENKHEHI